MAEQKALVLGSLGGEFAVKNVPVPTPGPGQILVKILASALNPVDWKIPVYKLSYVQNYPAILGSDTAGTVEAVGEGVTAFKKGDRV